MSIIKSFSVGNGDMFYIRHNSDNFTTIDCCYDCALNRLRIFNEIFESSKGKGITRFISTHPDEDHIKGLKEYNNRFRITNFYCVQNEATKDDESDDFKEYCKLRDGKHHFYLYKNAVEGYITKGDITSTNKRNRPCRFFYWWKLQGSADRQVLITSKVLAMARFL